MINYYSGRNIIINKIYKTILKINYLFVMYLPSKVVFSVMRAVCGVTYQTNA